MGGINVCVLLGDVQGMVTVEKAANSESRDFRVTAKISPPRLPTVQARPRLFQHLDTSRHHPVIWISAPGGYGKTTLVAHYIEERQLPCLWYQLDAGDADIASFFHYLGLAVKRLAPRVRRPMPVYTSEYFGGLPIFARRYFEELAARVPNNMVWILDNYQELPADAVLHEIIRNGVNQLPPGINIIILSRHLPPPVFAANRANASMTLIGEEALRFNSEETHGVAALRIGTVTTPLKPLIDQLHERTHGWAAGLILMLEQINAHSHPQDTLPSVTPDTIFEYFHSELFRHAPEQVRTLLLHTVYLPTVSPEAASLLSSLPGAVQILAELNRHNFFTQRHAGTTPVYQYHPLLREFLHTQAQTYFTETQRRALICASAEILIKEGRIDAAGHLLMNMREFEALARVCVQHASGFLARGMHQTLADWIAAIPEALREQEPWLLYWWGNSRLPFNPTQSYDLFAQAFAQFKVLHDAEGIYLSWVAAVEANTLGWIAYSQLALWILRYEEVAQAYPDFPNAEIEARVTCGMFMALMNGQPDHPAMSDWEQRLTQVVERIADPGKRLMMGCHLYWYYDIWLGDFTKSALMREALRPNIALSQLEPVVQILWSLIEVNVATADSGFEEYILAQRGIRDKMIHYGIRVYEHFVYAQEVYPALYHCEYDTARRALNELKIYYQQHPAQELGPGHYYFMAGWEAYMRSDYDTALQHIQMCKQIADKYGGPQQHSVTNLACAQALYACGQHESVDELVGHAEGIAIGMKSPIRRYAVLMFKAFSTLKNNDTANGLNYLAEAMLLARQNNYLDLTWFQPAMTSYLCGRALEAGIEPEYATRLIRLRHLTPDPSLRQIDQWPWPIKIYTLGSWRIVKDGVALAASGKGQRRPLDLLMALIALGGKDVKEVRLTELVWPDADGDAGYAAFKTTLSRLRKLLGDDAILFNDGRLSLNPACVWLDVWAFDDRLRAGLISSASIDSTSKIEQALQLYQGHFLAEEPEQFWMIALRERLRAAFLDGLRSLAQTLRDENRFTDAVQWYERGLTVDGLIEEFYQGLMACHLEGGQHSDVLRVYERCRRVLRQTFNIEPSTNTQVLHEQAITNSQIKAQGSRREHIRKG
jgi:LuxR family maltose regulon positive regulatory protein